MEALKKEKRAVKRYLSKLREEIQKQQIPKTLDFENLSKLESILVEYKVQKTKFETLNENLIALADEHDPNFDKWEAEVMQEIFEVANVVFTCEGKIKAFYKDLSIEGARTSLLPNSVTDLNRSGNAPPNVTQPKLKKIDVPRFDGDILKFPNFRHLFENLIHNNEDLINVQKLYYLKEALVGDAEEIVRDFPLEDRAYPEAWSYVLSRYDNPRKVIKTLFRKLTNLKVIKSDVELRKLLDQVDVVLRGLKAADEIINETFSRFVAFLVTSKLDVITARDFENSITTTKAHPTYEELREFLQIRSFVAEDRPTEPKLKSTVSTSRLATSERKPLPNERKANLMASSSTSAGSKIKCVACADNHYLNQCSKFRNMKVSDRYDIVKQHKLCLKCFNPFHVVNECSRYDCIKCKGKHHTMLHRDTPVTAVPTSEPSSMEREKFINNGNNSKVSCLSGLPRSKRVYLSTAIVKICVNSKWVLGRVLLDSGSELHMVSNSFVKRNMVPVEPTNLNLIGITDHTTLLNSVTQLTLHSRFSTFELSIETHVVPKIPYSVVNDLEKILNLIPGLEYAEMNLPYNDVDILLGIEHYEAIMENDRKSVNGLTIRKSKFGYIVSGVHQSTSLCSEGFVGLTTFEINQQLEKFWRIEESSNEYREQEENENTNWIEKKFDETYTRNPDGKFVVELLTKPGIETLDGSFGRALNTLKRYERYLSVEKKLAYCEFMTEYEALGHMRKLNVAEIESTSAYYIPHHIIARPSSTTTKYRVVFNASAIDKSGSSLNDFLYVGPTLQPELFDTIIRFRKYNIAFIADVEKMYRQILIQPSQRRFQRILWRPNTQAEINHYELNTVTYGTASAPYLATKCLQVLSKMLLPQNVETADAIANHFYMDDLMTGHENVAKAIELQRNIHAALASVHFPLRKYQSNSCEFLNRIDPNLVADSDSKLIGAESFVFVLGLVWYHKSDKFSVSINCEDLPAVITKRIVLSDISKVFDVLGILSPITVRAKLILQDLWREDLGWDDPISENLMKTFLAYRESLKLVSNFSIERHLSKFKFSKLNQLIGFCDASARAYCAVIYVRSIDEFGGVDVKFVCGKTRVAPLKDLTIPRLELMSAVMLSKLIVRIRPILNIDCSNVILFSDSTIVLSWLKLPTNKLKSFVANRISIITKNTNGSSWYHIPTEKNPADVGTRGLSAEKFLVKNIWVNGPNDLIDNFAFLLNTNIEDRKNIPELRKEKITSLNSKCDVSILYRYSSYEKLLNIIAYIYRFVNCCRCSDLVFENKIISVSERETSFLCIVKLSQRSSFQPELSRLIENHEVKKISSLRSLSPFLDNCGIMRVGGRLKNTNLTFEKKHPIILSAKCNFVRLYLTYFHEKYFHCNKGVILANIVNKFWIVGGCTNIVKRIIRECVLCCRLRAVLGQQVMGQLPASRTSVSRPFTNVGVDFTGHFTIKCLNHRSWKTYKVYAAFFVCFSTRAVHIELVSDLTSEKFIEALQRFISRRGRPACLYSDNGRNFVGANNIFGAQRNKLKTWSASEMIDWRFIVPRTPHQGGLWESAIKAGKSLLVKATKNSILTLEELSTILCRVECILNSRPLCYKVKADDAFEVITPGHFLIGDNFLNSAENLDDVDLNLDTRLTRVRNIVNSFWKQWNSSYLNELQRRNKWQSTKPNLRVGDIVVVKEDNLHVLSWPTGLIIETLGDSDGIIRNCKIKLPTGIVYRNVSRLVKLFSPDERGPISPPE